MTAAVHFIKGHWQAGEGLTMTSVDPAKNEQIWEGQSASAKQVEKAVDAAREAFPRWSLMSFEQRLDSVKRFSALLDENRESLAAIIAQETGKPLWETRTEIGAMIGKVDISVKAYHERTGIVENTVPGGQAFIRHRPHGVVAVFGPYNFPGHLPNGHIVPALLAGNTVVFKPSELTPLVAQKTVELWAKSGLPEGVLNLVQGEVETGKALAGHPGIDGLFFTGSSTTGKLLHEQYAGQPGKILALEMGGNNPLIVKSVSNIDAAVHDIIQSAFVTSGQRCTCARRLFIEDNAQGQAILDKLVAASAKIQVGIYDAEDQPFMGAMISSKAAAQMVAAQASIEGQGGEVLLRMQHIDPQTGLVTPGIVDVSETRKLPDEEHFGPLLKVYRYQSFEQAIKEANNTRFGLSAGLLSDERTDYDYFLPRIRAGIVNWNRPITGASSAAPFGGIGDSGNHRASAYYAADYCAYPVASVEAEHSALPEKLNPGLTI